MKLLTVSFLRNISSSVNFRMDLQVEHDKKYVFSSEKAIFRFIENTDFSDYTHVICMGMYGGRDQSVLRLETACSSKFRARDELNEVVKLEPFIVPTDGIKLATGIGTSYCNLLAFCMTRKLRNDQKFTFIHIPKRMRIEKAVRLIEVSLNN
jgi:pyrrolidone-carboxylate peptidase